MERECDYCDKEKSGLSMCSGCHKAWYCGPECQKAHWKNHRLRCLHPSKLTSADRLAIAANRDFLPNEHDTQVLRDYGFARVQVARSENWLLGLFQGMITYGEVDPRIIHRQRLAGTLIEYIKNHYESIPINARGAYYPWFLKNQHLLDQPKFIDTSLVASSDDNLQSTWRFIGESSIGTTTHINSQIQNWPEAKQQAFRFVRFLLYPGFQLSPDIPEWIRFGFCGCSSRDEEERTWNSYVTLIKRVSFEEFHAAYDSATLPALFSANNLAITNPFILDVLSAPRMNKSVWNLKQFVLGDYQKLIPSITVDYGFMNCGDPESPETENVIHSLRQVYRRVLTAPNANPLKLHEACLQGKLFQYAKRVAQVDASFAPLMKNIYPLPK
jgi:hypothetical protein